MLESTFDILTQSTWCHDPDTSSIANCFVGDRFFFLRPMEIAVEAATIHMSLNVAVGILTTTEQHNNALPAGTRVAALYRPPLQRYTSITQAVEIPQDCNAGEAAAVLSTYLPALSILNFGKKNYREKRLLIHAEQRPDTLVVKSIFHLAKLSGIKELFFGSNHFERYLDLPGVAKDDGGLMDVVIDFLGMESIHSRVASGGRLVLCSFDDPLLLKISKWNTALMLGGHLIDRESITFEPADVSFLLAKLEKRKLRPEIDCYTNQMTRNRDANRVVVVEPWKEMLGVKPRLRLTEH